MKSNPRKARKLIILSVVAVSSFVLSGCYDIDEAIAWDIAEEFLSANDIYSPANESFNVAGFVSSLAEEMWDEATNSEEATALDGLDIIARMEQADAVSESARALRNLPALGEAIKLRPNDWNYREDAFSIAVAIGDTGVAENSLKASDDLVNEAVAAGGKCFNLRANQLSRRVDSLEQQLGTLSQEDPNYSSLQLAFDISARELSDLYSNPAGNLFCQGK